MVEQRFVDPLAAGSIPVGRPMKYLDMSLDKEDKDTRKYKKNETTMSHFLIQNYLLFYSFCTANLILDFIDGILSDRGGEIFMRTLPTSS